MMTKSASPLWKRCVFYQQLYAIAAVTFNLLSILKLNIAGEALTNTNPYIGVVFTLLMLVWSLRLPYCSVPQIIIGNMSFFLVLVPFGFVSHLAINGFHALAPYEVLAIGLNGIGIFTLAAVLVGLILNKQ